MPAPTTPTLATLRAVSRSTPGTRSAARSAKKTWRSALASRLSRSSTKVRLSSARPSWKEDCRGKTDEALRFLTAVDGLLVLPGVSSAGVDGTERADRRRRTAPGAAATAAATTSSSTRSMMPRASASLAFTILAPQIMSRATAMPVRRGRRCVPPAPGTRPSRVSGSPTEAPGAAILRSQASAISSPPPSAAPLMAATSGLSMASMASTTSASSGGFGGWFISLTSAPATKQAPPPVMTIAATDWSEPASRIASIRPARAACDIALTGGLSMVTTATAPTRRIVTGLFVMSPRQKNACKPVCARPRMSACTSCVPS